MATESNGKKPDQAGGTGLENDTPEVAGRARRMLYVCGICGAMNYADSNWKWLTCWKCSQRQDL
jgi:hypothetical protein